MKTFKSIRFSYLDDLEQELKDELKDEVYTWTAPEDETLAHRIADVLRPYINEEFLFISNNSRIEGKIEISGERGGRAQIRPPAGRAFPMPYRLLGTTRAQLVINLSTRTITYSTNKI